MCVLVIIDYAGDFRKRLTIIGISDATPRAPNAINKSVVMILPTLSEMPHVALPAAMQAS